LDYRQGAKRCGKKRLRPFAAELALLFGRAFGQTPQYWLNLQSAYDLRKAQHRLGTRLKQIETLVA
jgi:plasmid maintenance system antidote protein VapI